MIKGDRIQGEDLPDLPHSRQLKAGFPWLTFDAALEPEFRQAQLEEKLAQILRTWSGAEPAASPESGHATGQTSQAGDSLSSELAHHLVSQTDNSGHCSKFFDASLIHELAALAGEQDDI